MDKGVSNTKLLKAILANSGAKKMNRDMIGFCTRKSMGRIQENEASFFSSAVRDEDLMETAQGKQQVHPFFVSRLIIPFMKEIWVNKDLNLNILRMVHATQNIHWKYPLHVGDEIEVECKITDITETPAGELLEVTGTIYSGNDPLITSVTGMMVRGRKRKRKPKQEQFPGQEKFRLEIPTEDGMQLTYARASGDNNFIHTKKVMAKMAGLPRTVMHGACVLALGTSALTRQLAKGDYSRVAGVQCRFSYPAIPGAPLTLIGYDSKDPLKVPFDIVNPAGRAVIKNAELTLTP